LTNRTPKNCRDRYVNFLDPFLNQAPWNPGEDDLFLELIEKFGKKWAQISTYMNHRSPGNLKNRWHKHLRIKFEEKMDESIPKKTTFESSSTYFARSFKKKSASFYLGRR
jgi:hypothetical protein